MIQKETEEKSVFEEIPTQKIYSEKAIKIGTFFAGPLVAGYCMAENFKVFNDFEKAKKTWIITLISAVLIIALVFLIPENVPSFIFPVIYLSITSYLVKTFQEKDIQTHIANGGETFNGWRTTIVGLISVAVFLSVILAAGTIISLL
ncbi:hypothetical protein [Flavobacterium olei]|uniref:hypothetical protein n=1 Tax=Flavobacterium olei TaxID=1886782 RepID=UPI00321A77DF